MTSFENGDIELKFLPPPPSEGMHLPLAIVTLSPEAVVWLMGRLADELSNWLADPMAQMIRRKAG